MSHVQSVILSRRAFRSEREAVQKILDMGFTVYKIDTTRNSYRFRQETPNYDLYYYRTKKIKPGIKFIIGYPIDRHRPKGKKAYANYLPY